MSYRVETAHAGVFKAVSENGTQFNLARYDKWIVVTAVDGTVGRTKGLPVFRSSGGEEVSQVSPGVFDMQMSGAKVRMRSDSPLAVS